MTTDREALEALLDERHGPPRAVRAAFEWLVVLAAYALVVVAWLVLGVIRG